MQWSFCIDELELRSIIGVLDLVALRQDERRDLGACQQGVKTTLTGNPIPSAKAVASSERGHTRPEQQIDN